MKPLLNQTDKVTAVLFPAFHTAVTSTAAHDATPEFEA
jgi:hypothetical protein